VNEESPRVLVVDDEKVIREILSEFLTMEGYVVRAVGDGQAALAELTRRSYDLVISDLKMPQMGGLELLEHIATQKLNVLVVIMTGFGTVETAIEAMKKGAYDYILKPFKVEDVVRIVQRGLDRQLLAHENIRLQEAVSLYRVSEAITSSLSLDTVLETIVDATVDELKADLVSLVLEDPRTQSYEERIRRRSQTCPQSVGTSKMNLEEVLAHYASDKPLLVHGLKAYRYFADPDRDQPLQSFCSIPLKVQSRVIGMLNAYSYTRGHKFEEGQRKMLSVLGSRAAVTIENARLYEDLVDKNQALVTANASLEENFRQTIVGFAHALEESDRYTRGHSERVSMYARLIAVGLSLKGPEIDQVVQAALLHDIGKIGIRYDKLNKPGKLTPEEIALFRSHPQKGKRILEPIPCMRHLIDGAHCHHEHVDGSGYPQGLMNDGIPLLGRIVAVADTYDAMTSDRAYRKALPHQAAVHEIDRCSGTQFDAAVVEVFLREIELFRKQRITAGLDVPR
jgi:response regulator RpfG family c-di-GMP phosphodiesterase